MAKVNRLVSKMADEKLRQLLLAGHFPKVNYEENGHWKSYSMMDYSMVNAKFVTIIHNELQAAGYPKGAFSTRLSNKKFLDIAKGIIDSITPERVETVKNRLRTMWD
ncbi:MAG: hypothetical protein KQI81_08760 [Deltaproteobacteria bacterium]|nr:hypothetical protein [Deltaproteobacteria bacterium]